MTPGLQEARIAMTPLPSIPEPSRLRHVWFEVSDGHWTALGILTSRLGIWRTTRLLTALLWAQATEDPFAALPQATTTEEWLTRRQLGPVLLLDHILRTRFALSAAETRDLVGDLVSAVGARLLRRRFPPLDRAAWRAATEPERETLVRRVFAQLGNIARAEISTSPDGLALDVSGCRFVQLCHQLERSELASLFCAADGRFFDTTEAPVALRRSTTLAGGGVRCDFRFRLPND